LSLLAERPDIKLIGIDVSPQMVVMATRKATQAGAEGARFMAMPMEELTLEVGTADAVVSRMGALAFAAQNGPATAQEVARILAPEAPWVLATWDTLERNVVYAAVVDAFADHVQLDPTLPAPDFSTLSSDARRERWLREAGMASVETELFPFHVNFASLDAVWAMAAATVASRMMQGMTVAERGRRTYGVSQPCSRLVARYHVEGETAFEPGPDGHTPHRPRSAHRRRN